MKNSIAAVTFACLSIGAASTGWAAIGFGDLDAPAWRGANGSTYQHWTFPTNNQVAGKGAPYLAEDYTNPNGNPTAQPYYKGTSGAGWSASLTSMNSMSNVWDLGVWNNITGAKTNGLCTEIIPLAAGLPATAYTYVWLQTLAFKGTATPYGWWATNMVTSGTQISTNAISSGVPGSTIVGYWTDYRELSRVTGSSVTNNIRGQTNGTALKELIVDTLTINVTNPANISLFNDPGQSTHANVNYAIPAVSQVLTNIACTPPNGSTFSLGTTPVNCAIVDLYGKTNAVSFSVTISLPPAPQFTQCAASQTNALGTACQIAIPDMTGGVIATGLNRTLSQSPAAATMVGPGQHTVTFTVWNDGGTNTCTAAFVVTGSAPVAVNDPLDATAGASSTMTAAKLLLNDSSPDGRAMQVVGVTSPSAMSGTVTFDGTSIVYTPASGYTGPDSFTYTNQDCAGLFSTAQVVINVTSATNFLNLVSITAETIGADQVVTVLAQGIPNYSYTLVRATQLSDYASNWVKVATSKASSNTLDYGQILYRDTNPPSASFYRTKYPPMP